MTKIEKIQGLLEDVETDVRKSTVQDILIDLADWLKDSDPADKPGLKVAIQILKSNYLP